MSITMKSKNNKLILYFCILIFLFIYLNACSLPSPPPSPNPQDTEIKPIPAPVIDKSNQFIIAQVGQEYFTAYISFDSTKSRYYDAEQGEHISAFMRNPYYLMVYSLKIPEKPFVNGMIQFTVDINGDVIAEREPDGIPQRLKDPQEGEFPIDEQMAIDIAKDAGLEAGIKDWKTSWYWYAGELKTYVWAVSTTLGESSGGAGGKVVIIDANTGILLMTSGWSFIPN
jgi:hypothetical protein